MGGLHWRGFDMRYAIVSDIHGNLPAWNTVLADISIRRVDRIICLGDVVGYGPEPAEVLKSVYERVHLMVLGNHDAVVAGRMSVEMFNDRARHMIEWTTGQLGAKACEFFSGLPLVLKGDNFRCVHGDFADPAMFDYITTPEEALKSFNAVSEQLLFCGHSHQTSLFVIGGSGVPHALSSQDFTLEEGKRYIVNVGSVGSPRDNDPRATYVIYDEEAKSVRYFRLPYDFEAFRAAVARKKLGPDEVPLLRKVQTDALVSVRESFDFSPASQNRVTGAVVENDVSMLLRKSNARWKRMTVASLLVGGVALVAAGVFATTAGPSSVAYPEKRLPPISVASSGAPDANLLPAISPLNAQGFSAPPFRVVLGDSRKQAVSAEDIGQSGRACVVLKSASQTAEVRFEVPDIEVGAGDKFEVFAKAKFSDDFQGSLSLSAWLVKGVGQEVAAESAVWMMKSFNDQVGLRDENLPETLRNLPNNEGWRIARGTTDSVPADGRLVRIELAGKFTGSVKIGGVALKRK